MESCPTLHDIVVSGGDSYYLQPEHILMIGERLISMDNIKRFRFASKGLAVSPNRILDKNDQWVDAIIRVSEKARKMGKAMALHTHFNHPNEVSWITEVASQKLLEAGVTVRNQTVLLRGVNDDVATMSQLVRTLADINVLPVSLFSAETKLLSLGDSRSDSASYSITSTNATWWSELSISGRLSGLFWNLRLISVALLQVL